MLLKCSLLVNNTYTTRNFLPEVKVNQNFLYLSDKKNQDPKCAMQHTVGW